MNIDAAAGRARRLARPHPVAAVSGPRRAHTQIHTLASLPRCAFPLSSAQHTRTHARSIKGEAPWDPLPERGISEADEGLHHLPGVGRDDALEQRHRAGDRLLGEEGHDAEHREAAVVDLGDKALLLLLRREVARPLERVVEVEADPVGQLIRGGVEVGEAAGLAALHVVRLAVEPQLRPPLEEADAKDDLPLGGVGQRVPLLGRRARGGDVGEGNRRRQVPRPVHAVGLQDVADEAGHSNAAVLDLGVAEPPDGLLVGVVPELRLGELQRIPEADRRVELGGERLQIPDGLHAHIACGPSGVDGRDRRRERRDGDSVQR
eukprot:CAMPEP_0206160968 /NCGR_PEP_ID=MMETSP1474-20131121/7252_1 /ASSEMBLY_ACC=CAM_ASM_001110 /TAXON_ID=97495 /ORGANISM="Imantonia sp., Strain RCC918" /LENGTH=319 /DNA_ID=CAMNT_0053562617 /DNA_START=146 /DNA_END=1105 /DNA_ORIENTATION=-